MDLDFGPDGALYVIEWGSGFNGNNADSGVYRIDYLKGDQNPTAHAAATPTEGLAPLTVNFSSAGSADPEGTAVTYAWDFGDGGTSTAANPSHVFATNGSFQVKLTVTDAGGLTGVSNTVVTVGNRSPVVTIEMPGGRPDRVLHRPGPLPDLGHRPGGRHDRCGHRLRQRAGHRLARP